MSHSISSSSSIEDEARIIARNRAIEKLAEELQLPEHLAKVYTNNNIHILNIYS